METRCFSRRDSRRSDALRAASFARPILFLLTIFATIAILGFSARQASAMIYYVCPGGTGTGLSWATCGSFQPILSGAKSGDQVWVEKGGYVGNFTATDGVTVYGGFAGTETSPSQRTFTSRNASILDANGSGTVYTIPTAAAGMNTLDGFTVESGTNRGVYDPSGDKLVVSNCTITNNSVTDANGGGIYANGVSVAVTNCSFTNNSANRVNANNIQVYGGGIYTGSSTVATISTCIFTGNNATTNYGPDPAYGGGIFSFDNATISGCTFSGNGATSYDSGIGLEGDSSTVTTCTFTGNTNCGLGSYGASTSVSGCTFTNNGGRGMALFNPGSSTVSNCTFTSNNVSDGDGGGLYTDNLDTTVDHCTFTGNSANRVNANNVQIYGGGLFTDAETNTTVTFCTFTGNSATTNYNPDPAFGGGLGAFGTPYIANCTFMGNTPEQIQLEKVGSPNSPAYVVDCLIYASGGSSSYPNVPDAVGVAQYASSTFAYVTISNNDILNAVNNAGVSIGTGTATGGAVSVANNIFYGNGTALYNNSSVTFVSSHNDAFDNATIYSGATLSPTDLMVDPKFVRNPNFSASPVDYGDLHLQFTSPLINAGDDSYVETGDTDVAGDPRIIGSHVDIGAYEAPLDSAAHLTSIGPSSVQAGYSSFMLTVNGTGFVSGAVVNWNNAALTTKFISATQLGATVPASLVASVGTASVTVTNPGMGESGGLTFTITAAATITNIAPSAKPAAGPAFTMTVVGTGFLAGAVVYWNGTALTTTPVSSTVVTASVPASLIAAPGSAVVTLANPRAGMTNPFTFTITTPIAVLTTLSPSTAQAGSPTLTLTITGANFVAGAVAKWGGTALASAALTPMTLVAQVPASLLATAGTASVTVTNPTAAVSNALPFTVTAVPAPAKLTNLSPATAQVGSATFTLTILGTGFVPGAVVDWNGVALASAELSATTAVAQVPASLLATAGTANVTVVNPGSTGSNALPFTITAIPAPAKLTSLMPSSAIVGTSMITLMISGSGFVNGAVVEWGSTALTTGYFNSTTIAALVPASLLATVGTVNVTVVNPGVAASNALPFTVLPLAPTITSFTPTSGPAGTSVTITGTNFTNATAVKFGGVAATFTVVSATQIKATVPTGAVTGTITVTTAGGTATSSASFTFIPAPSITSFTPTSGPVGTVVTVTGTNFSGTIGIKFGGVAATTFTVVSATQIKATVPTGAVTGTLSVATSGGSATSSGSFTVTP